MVSFGLNAVAQDNAAVWYTDVKKAADMSIKEKKTLFFFYTGSDWCAACKRLQNEVFLQPQFQSWAEKNVILVELDFPRKTQLEPELQQQNRKMKEIFGVSSYPTVVFVTPSKHQNQLYYTKIGRTGYYPGGPDTWVSHASQFLPSAK